LWLSELDAAIAERHLLHHPFYRDWEAGTLSRERLRFYAIEYDRHVAAFPKHLRSLACRATGKLREIVLENLAEEENASAPHPKLWRDFASALGVKVADFSAHTPLRETEELLKTYSEVCSEGPPSEAVAMLYAYEAQVPEIASVKIDG